MLLYFFIGLAALSTGSFVTIIWRQLAYVRSSGLVTDDSVTVDLWEVIQNKIDSSYHRFAQFFKRALRYGYLYSLVGLRRFIIIVRFILTKIERKFARLIDSVHGQGQITKSAAPASSFIAEMKDHKAAALAGFKNGEH